ncbi:VOC family protein [Nocardia nova]|uniref:VOC family protein n=1 Tax=Nocardia nova TaxID=37330 RepID=UPI00189606BB|nr:VOC family protein [Nocardia nova]MBF6147312.1 VOC family protein [Nocardia nova]MDN2498311.1 VOC family protein [Nocardia nova]
MIRWSWMYIDRPAALFDEAFAFWSAVTGTRLSARQGEHAEFATLDPATGDAYQAAQAVGGDGGAHLDIDVVDLDRARRAARDLGATLVADHDTWSLVRSPHGLPFCLTTGEGRHIPAPVAGPDGTFSRVDQLCFDIPPSGYDGEAAFWSALTGWPVQRTGRSEFARLLVPARLPIRILLQRLDTDREPGAHIDIACADAEAVAAWHESLGARRVRRGAQWLVMDDPVGGVYCLTERDPLTGKVFRRGRG